MTLTKKILLWLGISTCLGFPIILWILAVVILFDDPTLFEPSFHNIVIFIVILGLGGILGLISLLASTIGRNKLLFNKLITKIFLLMGVLAILIYGINMLTPFYWFKSYEPPMIVLIYLPLACTACVVYIFRNMLFLNQEQ